MLKISTWDEISCEWATHELDLPPDTSDPNLINQTLGELLAGAGEGDGYTVVGHSTTGPILTIECRDDRNHLAILIVNSEEQE